MVANIVSARAAFSAEPRGELTLAAAGEVEAIAAMLQRKFCGPDVDFEDLAFRALAIRLERLASAILTCVGDEAGDPESVRKELEGPELNRARMADAA